MDKNNSIAFTCPFCYADNYHFFELIDEKLIKKEVKNGYICKQCGLRIVESLIIDFINDYNFKFL